MPVIIEDMPGKGGGRRKNPAALQMVRVMHSLRATSSTSQRGINHNLKGIHDILKNSNMLNKNTTSTMLDFFKNATPLLNQIKNAVSFVAKSLSKGIPGGAPTTTTSGGVPLLQKPLPFGTRGGITSDMLEDLTHAMKSVSFGTLDLSDTIDELQYHSKIKLDPTQLASIKGDWKSLLGTLSYIYKKVLSVKKGTGGIAEDFEVSEDNINQLLRDFREITHSTHFTALDYYNVEQRIKEVVFGLSLAERRLSKTADSTNKIGKGFKAITTNLTTQAKSLLKLHGKEFLLGSIEGAKSFIKHVATLEDMIIDLRKVAQFDLPPEQWRKDIVQTATDFSNASKPIYALPTDIAESFIALAKAGVRSEKQIKDLGKTIFLLTRATNISTESAASLGFTMTKTWGLTSKEATQVFANLLQTSRNLNIPLEDLIERTKTLGQQFLLSFRAGEVEGQNRVRFLNELANAVGSVAGISDDTTVLLQNMVKALQTTPEAALKFAPFLTDVRSIQEALRRGQTTKAFELLLSNLSALKTAAKTGGDQLNEFAKLTDTSFTDLNALLNRSKEVIIALRNTNKTELKDYSSSLTSIVDLAAADSQKIGKANENFIKKFWANVQKSTGGAVSFMVQKLAENRDALLGTLAVLKIFGLDLSSIGKIFGLVGSSIGKYIFAVASAKLGTTLFSTALSATTFGGFLKEIGKVIASTLGLGAAANVGTISFGALAGAVWAATWPLLAVAAAVAAIVLVWYKWDKIVAWFQKTFPGWSKGVELAMSAMRDEWNRDVQAFKDWWNSVKLAYTGIKDAIKVVWDYAKSFADWIGSKIEWWQRKSDALRAKFHIKTEARKEYEAVLKQHAAERKQREEEKKATLERAVKIKAEASQRQKIHQAEIEAIRLKIRVNKQEGKVMAAGQKQTVAVVQDTIDSVDMLGNSMDTFARKINNVQKGLVNAFDPKTRAFATFLDKGEKDFGTWYKHMEMKTKRVGSKIAMFTPDIEEAITKAAKTSKLPANLIRAVVMQESGGNPASRSPAGARGLMQLMPGTARDLGLQLKDIYDVNKNVAAGTTYLARLLERYNGDISKALAAYNWGMGNLSNYLKGSIKQMPKETRDYIQKVLQYYMEYQKQHPPTFDVTMNTPQENKTLTPEPMTKVTQPLPPTTIVAPVNVDQDKVVTAIKEGTATTKELIQLIKTTRQASIATNKSKPGHRPDELTSLVGQYQT